MAPISMHRNHHHHHSSNAASDDANDDGSRSSREFRGNSSLGSSRNGIFNRLRGRKPAGAKTSKPSSVLDLFENMRVREGQQQQQRQSHSAAASAAAVDDDASSAAPSLASTLSSGLSSGCSSLSSERSGQTRLKSQLKFQKHASPSLTSLTSCYKSEPNTSLLSRERNPLQSTRSQFAAHNHPAARSLHDSLISQRPPNGAAPPRPPSASAAASAAAARPQRAGGGEGEGKQERVREAGRPTHMTPLHNAIDRIDTPLPVLLQMLSSNPSAASIRCSSGLDALDLLWKRFVEPANYRSDYTKSKAAALKSAIEMVNQGSGDRRGAAQRALEENQDLKQFWEVMKAFIRASSRGDAYERGEQGQIVHDAVRIDCESLIVKFALSLHPEQLRERDAEGNLPIHLLKSSRSLDAVLQLYPQAASQRNAEGRLPLHLAVENGFSWDGALQALVMAWPGALMVRDPKTGLLPALMSNELNTAFCLIKANPMEPMNYALEGN